MNDTLSKMYQAVSNNSAQGLGTVTPLSVQVQGRGTVTPFSAQVQGLGTMTPFSAQVQGLGIVTPFSAQQVQGLEPPTTALDPGFGGAKESVIWNSTVSTAAAVLDLQGNSQPCVEYHGEHITSENVCVCGWLYVCGCVWVEVGVSGSQIALFIGMFPMLWVQTGLECFKHLLLQCVCISSAAVSRKSLFFISEVVLFF